MIDIRIDASEFRRAANAELVNLARGCEAAVDEAGRKGKTTARVLAPHRSYDLRNSIDARVTSAGSTGAEGELEAIANHASFMADGTKPHAIEARRKKMLRWVGPSGVRFARRVMHPGTKPNDYFRRAMLEAEITLVRAGENVANASAARMSR